MKNKGIKAKQLIMISLNLKLKHKKLFFIKVLLLISSLRAQEPVFRHYSIKDGIPSSETYSIIQDKKGYVWISTDRGLCKFNGYEFQTYTTDNSPLLDNTIFGLYKDHRNWIWYFGYTGLVGFINNDKFHSFKYNHILREKIMSKRLEGISIDRNGGFISGFSTELTKKPIFINQPICIDSNGIIKSLSFSQKYKDIYFSENNTCIVVGNKNAKATRLISQEKNKIIVEFQTLPSDINNMTSFVCKKKNGDILIYCSKEIFLYNKKGIFKLIKCKERVLSMLLDSRENLWIGYQNKGLELYLSENDTYKLKQFYQLSQKSVSSITQDNEGGLWFTTLEDGVFYLTPNFLTSYGEHLGLLKPKTRFIEKVNNNLFFGMSDNSIIYKNKDSPFLFLPKEKSFDGINDIACSKTGKVFYSSFKLLNNPILKHWSKMTVQKIHIGKYNVWGFISTELCKQVGIKDSSISFKHIGKITSIYEIGNNQILVGTLNGLYYYNSGKITSLKHIHPILKTRVSSIVSLGLNHLVIGTIGSGLLIIERNGFHNPIHYSRENGMLSNMCNTLLSIDKSTILVGTNNGISKIENAITPSIANIISADLYDGLVSNEVNDLELVDDKIWIATSGGITELPLQYLTNKKSKIQLHMEDIKVSNNLVNKNTYGLFSYKNNNIHFTFTGINYQYTKKLKYRYRLIGSDNSWQYTSNRTVIYNALLPGNYEFEVYVIDNNGNLTNKKIQYKFSILPPFWQSWWFIASIVIVIVLFLLKIISIYISKIKKQIQLQTDLINFKDKALRNQMNPHFIYNSMNSIQNYIKKNEIEASIEYLNQFSRLMRSIFRHSGEKSITLEEDLEAVKLYVDLENKRFLDKFRIYVTIDDLIKPSITMIPPFLIQPFVENSILHGFSNAQNGNIWISICKKEDKIKISIQDDGIGRAEANLTNIRKQIYLKKDKRTSTGINVTRKRIREFWGKNYIDDYFCITDLFDNNMQAKGTLVEFYLPIYY